VVSTATNAFVSSISVSLFPFALAMSPDGTKLFVSNFGGLSIVDTASNTVVASATQCCANSSFSMAVPAGTPGNLATQSVSFGYAPVLAVGGSGAVSATATSGLPVTFSSQTTSTCTVAASVVTAVAAGTCTIVATQVGNSTYESASSTQNITVNPANSPLAGYWWNPAESGRGFVIEIQGTDMFMAGFLYAANGEASWVASTGPMTSPTQYAGSLITYAGGQTLMGNYQAPSLQPALGTISISFSSDSQGMLTWPGGTIPIQRFNFGPGGAGAQQSFAYPETGWWWNPMESGRGYAVEVQDSAMYFAAYMYDTSGNPVWYLASGNMTSATSFTGTLTQYGNGQTLTGSYVAPTLVNADVGTVTILFNEPDTAQLTLPGGHVAYIQRFKF
jgi:hypothetical protein